MPEFSLPALGYAPDTLEPHIDARTMEIHHGKHHQAYVNNLNAALKDQPALQEKSIEALLADLESVPEAIRPAVRNNGGGHANHTLFWDVLTPGGPSAPTGALASAIDSAFGSLDALKSAMNEAGTKRFGSGWAWLIADGGKLMVASTPNQDTPLMGKSLAGVSGVPLLGIDVWEHAYYLHYQNRRPDYLAAIWNVVNWDKVAVRLAAA